jgi:phosphoglycolate phosphatase
VIRLAVIDLAGTTVRDDGAVEGAFVDALRAVDAIGDGPPSEEVLAFVRGTMGMSKVALFRERLGDEARATAANAAFEAAYAVRVQAGETEGLPGAETALRELREDGVLVALTTGFSAPTCDLLIDTLGWRELIDLALTPRADLRGRPAPDLVLAALMRLRVDDVREVAVVGDTRNDLLAGHRAGASVLAGVLGGAHERAVLEAAPHTHLLESVADLPAALRAAA